MTSRHWATFATSYTLADIQSRQADAEETSVLSLLSDARERDNDLICIPLTTEAWKQRWSKMCILPGEPSENGEATKNADVEALAEAWRGSPAFQSDEVTITRLGVHITSIHTTVHLRVYFLICI